jgi:hypothetical protein
MRPLCITDVEYEGDDQELRNFSQFLLKTDDFH